MYHGIVNIITVKTCNLIALLIVHDYLKVLVKPLSYQVITYLSLLIPTGIQDKKDGNKVPFLAHTIHAYSSDIQIDRYGAITYAVLKLKLGNLI